MVAWPPFRSYTRGEIKSNETIIIPVKEVEKESGRRGRYDYPLLQFCSLTATTIIIMYSCSKPRDILIESSRTYIKVWLGRARPASQPPQEDNIRSRVDEAGIYSSEIVRVPSAIHSLAKLLDMII